MENITKKQFDKFVKLQWSSKINMTDIVRGAKMIKESEEVYETIMFNYKDLENKFSLK